MTDDTVQADVSVPDEVVLVEMDDSEAGATTAGNRPILMIAGSAAILVAVAVLILVLTTVYRRR